ncbi:MAG: S8 family serine peptidase, partial [Bryobacteraceae bacterium]
MKRLLTFGATWALFVGGLSATQNYIVRTTATETLLRTSCATLGCSVVYGLGDPSGQVFLMTIPDLANAGSVLAALTSMAGVTNYEGDGVISLQQGSPPIPAALYNTNLVSYFGTNVRYGYAFQPAALLIRLAETQSTFNVSGTGLVAVIDTGVDPDHPVLRNVLVTGYDFTRSGGGSGSEMFDVNQSTTAVVDGSPPLFVNKNTAALLDPLTAAVVGSPNHAAFGHGTMVAGIIHLVAPKAPIMPLKAFKSDGSGNLSDVLRAIYQAVRSNARVINMSFSTPQVSLELKRALDHATISRANCVASAGNDGISALFYPAAYDNLIG